MDGQLVAINLVANLVMSDGRTHIRDVTAKEYIGHTMATKHFVIYDGHNRREENADMYRHRYSITDTSAMR